MPGLTSDAPRGKTELVASFRLDLGDYVAAAEIARHGRSCIVGLGDGDIVGVHLETGLELFRQRAHAGGVLAVSLSHDGLGFITCGQEPCAKLWSATGDLVRELPGAGASWVEHVAWCPTGQRLALAAGRRVRVFDTAGDVVMESQQLASTASALAWRSDGTALAASCYGGVHVWPFVAGAKRRQLDWKGSLISLAWSPDGKVIACGSQDSTVHFWRLATGQDAQMSGYPFKPRALAWDHESKLLATSGDATVTLWDFRGRGPEGTRPIQLKGHKALCTRLAFSPRKGMLASGAQDTSVLLWEPRAAQPSRSAMPSSKTK